MAKSKTKVGIKVPTLNEITKRYGHTISLQATKITDHGLWLPFSFFALNYLTGGGIPWGKIIEIAGGESSGKTLAALDAARSAQKLGGHVIWVDAEQSWQNSWAELNGIDLEKITIITDTCVENISDAIADLSIYWRSQLTHNEPILLVVDSIAALDTVEAINAKMADGKAEMGNRAKAIYKMFRIRNELLYKLGITQIYINQLRTSLKTGFGQDPNCLHYETNIPFVDGTSMCIGDIVKNKINKPVWSLNIKTNKIEAKPITDWIKKDDNYEWYQIKTSGPGSRNGINGIRCTNDHLVLKSDGKWEKAQNIKVGDKLLSFYESRIKGFDELLAGILIGDCSIRIRKNTSAKLVLKDSNQPGYVEWKTKLLSGIFDIKSQGFGETQFNYNVELYELRKSISNDSGHISHLKVWDKFKPTWKSLAIWYMDDGHLFKNGQAGFTFSKVRQNHQEMIDYLRENFGLSAYTSNQKNIKLTHESTIRLFSMVAQYIRPEFRYKLTIEFRDEKLVDIIPPRVETEYKLIEVEVLENNFINKGRTLRRSSTYDISVEDNHNFIAGNTNTGFVVHNTTPGGKALAFYASIRLMYFPGKTLTIKHKSRERKVGKLVTIRVMKNKVAPPRTTISKTPVYYNPTFHEVGFDKLFGLDDVFFEEDIITKTSGGVYKYKEETLARGEEKFRQLLEGDVKLRRKLLKEAGINTIGITTKKLQDLDINLFPITEDIAYESQLDIDDEEENFEE